MLRFAAAGLFAILIAVQIIRTAAVSALADIAPEAAARAWASHPDVQLSLGMIDIATAARHGRPVSPAVFDRIYGASRVAPLAPEPYLVRGVQAKLSGNPLRAEQAFLQARWRDGRSLPAHYFLAEHYLRQRDAANGLREIAVLARLVPDGPSKLAPYLARYASDPANQRQLSALFRAEPALEDSALAVLAADPRSADLVLSLSNPARRGTKSAWLAELLGGLNRDRQYAKSRNIWASLSGVRLDGRELIYDPNFIRKEEPPPFNWALTSSTIGLAERLPGGGLHVIAYGREEGALAGQLLILSPGSYRLRTDAAGVNQASGLSWRLVCDTTNEPIASMPLDRAIVGGWRFAVPSTCQAQRLELAATAADEPQQSDVTIRSVSLVPERADA